MSLVSKQCKSCEGDVPALSSDGAATLLSQLDGWQLTDKIISKNFAFKNYYQTIAFVNATTWISHREGHHPDITVAYNQCRVEYTTHAINGLSENDFICAAKIDRLFTI